MLRAGSLALAALMALLVGGCGSSTSGGSTSSRSQGAGLLSAEAKSASTGDIPDSQVFLVFRDPQAGYRIKYPEGWAQLGGGADVRFSDKNNIVHVVMSSAGSPTVPAVSAELKGLKVANPTLSFQPPTLIHLSAGPAVKATYTTESAPNPVTGKRVQLTVDRYELAHRGKRVTVDLGTPVGVDNVDAYRMMINSFAWQ